MSKWLIWGGIFAAGVYVGSQITKQVVAAKITGGITDAGAALGLSNSTYGKPVINQLNQFVQGQLS